MAPRRRAAAFKPHPAITHSYYLRSTRGKAQVRIKVLSINVTKAFLPYILDMLRTSLMASEIIPGQF